MKKINQQTMERFFHNMLSENADLAVCVARYNQQRKEYNHLRSIQKWLDFT